MPVASSTFAQAIMDYHQLSRAIILICSLSLSLPVKSQTKPQTDFSAVRKLIQTQMAARGIPSISVAVARRGEIIWEEAFGFADKENRIPANKETMYYVASVTKTFTGIVRTYRGDVPLTLSISAAGDIQAKL
jgi:CubicO group peptidase (beta-lactamase class C family)